MVDREFLVNIEWGSMTSHGTMESPTFTPVPDRVYSNLGNAPLLDLLGSGCNHLLDIGCGAGDNAKLLKATYPEMDISGITHSAVEADLARNHLARCWVFDIEGKFPDDLAQQSFDALIFSHVLEHLRDPAVVLARFSRLLRSGGAGVDCNSQHSVLADEDSVSVGVV